MTVTTRNKTFPVKFANLMTSPDELMIVYQESRAAVEIADEWEGNEIITITDDRERKTEIGGYTRLVRLIRDTPTEVCICLQKEVNANA